jgi:hypothetical protein
MPKPQADFSRVNMTQLETLTGRDRRFLRQRFAAVGLEPVDTSDREKWYASRAALEAIYRSTDDLDLTEERARLSKEQADAQALKNAEMRGELVRGDDVDLFLLGLFGAFTQRIRAIPPKAAPEVRATTSDAEGEALLARFHDEALTELADAARATADRVAARGAREASEELRIARTSASAAAEADGEPVGRPREKALARVQRGAGTVENEPG